MPEPSLGKPKLQSVYLPPDIVDLERRLKAAEDLIRLVAHELGNWYVYHNIDNRLAKDVLERTASTVSAVKERLIGPK